MIPNHSEHVVLVRLVASKSSQFLRHFCTGCVAFTTQNSGQSTSNRKALIAVIRNAHLHQQSTQISVTETKRSEVVAQLSHFFRRELSHQDRNFENNRPQPNRVLVPFNIKHSVLLIVQSRQVNRSEITGGVIQEHVLRTRVRSIDATMSRTGVPLVNRGVVLQTRVRTVPSRLANISPKLLSSNGPHRLAVGSRHQIPISIILDRIKELIGHPNRVVAVLTRNRNISLRLITSIKGWELNRGKSILSQLNRSLNVIGRNLRQLRLSNRSPKSLIGSRVRMNLAVNIASPNNRIDMSLIQLGTSDQRGNLLLLFHLPVNKLFNIWMINIQANHLRGTSSGSTRLNRTRRSVTNSQEAHQAAALTAAAQLLSFRPNLTKISSNPRAILKDSCLSGPEVHDSALINQIILHTQNKASMRLWPLISVTRLLKLLGLRIKVIVPLSRTCDPISKVHPSVKPLRRVRSRNLLGKHMHQFIVKSLSIFGRIKISVALAP